MLLFTKAILQKETKNYNKVCVFKVKSELKEQTHFYFHTFGQIMEVSEISTRQRNCRNVMEQLENIYFYKKLLGKQFFFL
jgi:hypothetical protein